MQLAKLTSNDPNAFQSPGFWSRLGNILEEKNTEEYLSFAINELLNHGDLVFLTAFGAEGCVLIDILSKALKSIPEDRIIRSIDELERHQQSHNKIGKFILANLDTEYQFKESLELKERLEEKYKLPILLIKPEISKEEQAKIYGTHNLYESDPDQCCYIRKIKPLNKLLSNKLAWITSIRRDQTEVRAKAKSFEYDFKFKLGKINPLIKWTKSDIWKFIHENNVPYNPLLDQGYDSIGCEPCTKPGLDRQGRWAGKDKIECGLHLQDSDLAQGGEFVI